MEKIISENSKIPNLALISRLNAAFVNFDAK